MLIIDNGRKVLAWGGVLVRAQVLRFHHWTWGDAERRDHGCIWRDSALDGRCERCHCPRLSVACRHLVGWVLRLVAVDVVILSIWMLVDGPRVASLREVVGYAGESPGRRFRTLGQGFSPRCGESSRKEIRLTVALFQVVIETPEVHEAEKKP